MACQVSKMAVWFLILLPLLAMGQPQPRGDVNQTDLQVAIDDMRIRSYHGFVILLKILNSTSDLPQNSDVTFLMPNDEELSQTAPNVDSLRDFVLSHSIPSPLLLNNLMRFPNGTQFPSSVPNKMITITNIRNSGLLVNNAKIVTPNVCAGSIIKCHGISSTIMFDNFNSFSEKVPLHSKKSTKELSRSPNTHRHHSTSSKNKLP